MSQLRRGSRPSSTSASVSASSSYLDVRTTEDHVDAKNSTVVRRRRQASDDAIDPPWRAFDEDDWRHPLAGPSGSTSSSTSALGEDTAEASRPKLKRLTSEVDREVAAASAASRSSIDDQSLRGSLDLLRTALKPAGEIEVLMHQVKVGESLAGIALQYGIDLPTLRKVNKLWPSDPVSLRRHLYVPLEACRWSKSSQSVVRGPQEGQITLTTRKTSAGGTKGKGKGKATYCDVMRPGGGRGGGAMRDLSVERKSLERENIKANGDFVKANGNPLIDIDVSPEPSSTTSNIMDLERLSFDNEEVVSRIYDVLRLPASELSFFPKASKDLLSRKSLDNYSSTDIGDRPVIARSPSASANLDIGKGFIPIGAFRKPFMPARMTPVRPADDSSKPIIRIPSITRLVPPQLGSGFGSKLSTLFSMEDDGYSPTDQPIGKTSGGNSRNFPAMKSSRASPNGVRTMDEAPYELMPRSSMDDMIGLQTTGLQRQQVDRQPSRTDSMTANGKRKPGN